MSDLVPHIDNHLEKIIEDEFEWSQRNNQTIRFHKIIAEMKSAFSRERQMVTITRDKNGKPKIFCDPEIVDIVQALNNGGVPTIASCSGHGERKGNIALKDGRELIIANDFEDARRIEKLL